LNTTDDLDRAHPKGTRMLLTYIKATLLLLMANLIAALGWIDFLIARLETLVGIFASSPALIILFLMISLLAADLVVRSN